MIFAMFFFGMLEMIKTAASPFNMVGPDEIDPNSLLIETEQFIFSAFTEAQKLENRKTGIDPEGGCAVDEFKNAAGGKNTEQDFWGLVAAFGASSGATPRDELSSLLAAQAKKST